MTGKVEVDSSLMSLQGMIKSASSKLINASGNFQVHVIVSGGQGGKKKPLCDCPMVDMLSQSLQLDLNCKLNQRLL